MSFLFEPGQNSLQQVVVRLRNHSLLVSLFPSFLSYWRFTSGRVGENSIAHFPWRFPLFVVAKPIPFSLIPLSSFQLPPLGRPHTRPCGANDAALCRLSIFSSLVFMNFPFSLDVCVDAWPFQEAVVEQDPKWASVLIAFFHKGFRFPFFSPFQGSLPNQGSALRLGRPSISKRKPPRLFSFGFSCFRVPFPIVPTQALSFERLLHSRGTISQSLHNSSVRQERWA